jgi:hypothetical protein
MSHFCYVAQDVRTSMYENEQAAKSFANFRAAGNRLETQLSARGSPAAPRRNGTHARRLRVHDVQETGYAGDVVIEGYLLH